MQINTNVAAMLAYRATATQRDGVTSAMERLSSGLRINRAADDAAGLAITEGMRAQVNGLNQAIRNTRDGMSVVQTADGNLTEDHAILQRMRTLAVQAANGTNSPDNLRQLQAEMTQLMAQIDQIADSTQFNGLPLLDGTFVKKHFQVGANAGDVTVVTIGHQTSAAVPPTPPKFALWNLDDPDVPSKLPDPFVLTQELTATGEEITASVHLDPWPSSASELVTLLSADPAFSAAFAVTTGSVVETDGTRRDGVNIVITSKTPGGGEITFPNSDGLKVKFAPGADEVPAQYGGYHAAELLGGPIDLTRAAGSETVIIPAYQPSGGSLGEDFGDADFVPRPPGPPQPERTVTTTWPSGAADAIARIDRAIERVSVGRAELGATQNAFDHTARSAGVAAENLTVAASRIRDADIAEEAARLQRWQVLCQASMSMLAEAHKIPQALAELWR